MLTGKLPNSLTRVVITPLLKCKSKDPADVNNYRPIAIATALSMVLKQVMLRDSPGTCGLLKKLDKSHLFIHFTPSHIITFVMFLAL